MLLPKAAGVTGKCCSASTYTILVFGLSQNYEHFLLPLFTWHVKKGQAEYVEVVTKFDCNEINLSITDDGKPTNLGMLKTLE